MRPHGRFRRGTSRADGRSPARGEPAERQLRRHGGRGPSVRSRPLRLIGGRGCGAQSRTNGSFSSARFWVGTTVVLRRPQVDVGSGASKTSATGWAPSV